MSYGYTLDDLPWFRELRKKAESTPLHILVQNATREGLEDAVMVLMSDKKIHRPEGANS